MTRPPSAAARLGRYLRPLGPLVAFVAVAVVASRLTSATVVAGVVLGVAIVVAVVIGVWVSQTRTRPGPEAGPGDPGTDRRREPKGRRRRPG